MGYVRLITDGSIGSAIIIALGGYRMRNLPGLGWCYWIPLVTLLGACNASPTEPTETAEPSAAHGAFIEASIYCEPTGVDLKCDFWVFGGGGKLTNSAAWSLSDESIAKVSTEGKVTTLRLGEVDITAAYESRSATWQARLDPSMAPSQLLPLSGEVEDRQTNEAIEGVVVEISQGYGKGRRAVSDATGYYRIDRVLLEETRSMRAFKQGYSSTLIELPDGLSSTILNIKLSRTESP